MYSRYGKHAAWCDLMSEAETLQIQIPEEDLPEFLNKTSYNAICHIYITAQVRACLVFRGSRWSLCLLAAVTLDPGTNTLRNLTGQRRNADTTIVRV